LHWHLHARLHLHTHDGAALSLGLVEGFELWIEVFEPVGDVDTTEASSAFWILLIVMVGEDWIAVFELVGDVDATETSSASLAVLAVDDDDVWILVSESPNDIDIAEGGSAILLLESWSFLGSVNRSLLLLLGFKKAILESRFAIVLVEV
jgi:hypothetical protein